MVPAKFARRKWIFVTTLIVIAFAASSCSNQASKSSVKKPSIRETRWLETCRMNSFSWECEQAIADYASRNGKNGVFISLSNEKDDYRNAITVASGPHNVWCFINEERCYATIHIANNGTSPFTNSPTAMIQDGDWKFHYAVLEGQVSFDGIISWPLETEKFYDLNPGQTWRDIGVSQLWRVGFRIGINQMKTLQELNVGEAQTGAFAPIGPPVPLCLKSNSEPELIIYEDCRILNEYDFVNGKFQKKIDETVSNS